MWQIKTLFDDFTKGKKIDSEIEIFADNGLINAENLERMTEKQIDKFVSQLKKQMGKPRGDFCRHGYRRCQISGNC